MVTSTTSKQPHPEPSVPDGMIEAIEAIRAPIVVSHVVPDADALGSMLAWAGAWTSPACRPKISLPKETVSQRLGFMLDWSQASIATPADFAAADGFIVLDTAKKPRCNVGADLKETDWSGEKAIINIDHHATNTMFGRHNWVVERAGSTCELVYYLLRRADRPISGITASLLYAGIHTDTLGFTLPTTSTWALKAAADLVDAGADVVQLGQRLYRSLKPSEFSLLRIIYDNTRVVAGGRLAYSSASHEEIHGAGCTFADIDDQINVPRSLEGVMLSILFSEGRKGKTRINFRSAGNVTVVDLAAQYHGGGHAQSAGTVLDCPLDQAMSEVLPAAETHLAKFLES